MLKDLSDSKTKEFKKMLEQEDEAVLKEKYESILEGCENPAQAMEELREIDGIIVGTINELTIAAAEVIEEVGVKKKQSQKLILCRLCQVSALFLRQLENGEV